MTDQERIAGFVAGYNALVKKFGAQVTANVKLEYKEYGSALMVEPVLSTGIGPIENWQEPPPEEPPFGLTTEQILAIEPFIEQARVIAAAKEATLDDTPPTNNGHRAAPSKNGKVKESSSARGN